MFIEASTYFIPARGISGLIDFFMRRKIKKTAEEHGIPFGDVEKALEKARSENPAKSMVIVFSKQDDESPVLTIEEREAYFDRMLEQVNRTGILTSAPI